MQRVACIVSLLLLVVFGSIFVLNPTARSKLYRRPETFAARIAGADTVVASTPSLGSRITLTRDRATQVVKVISLGKPAGSSDHTAGSTLEFYRGSELLGTAAFGGNGFIADGREFTDRTGLLGGLEQQLKTTAAPAGTDPIGEVGTGIQIPLPDQR